MNNVDNITGYQEALDDYLDNGINYHANTIRNADTGDLKQLASDSFHKGAWFIANQSTPIKEQDKEVKEEMVYWCGKHGIATSQCTDFCDEYKGLIPDPRKASNIPPLSLVDLNKMAEEYFSKPKNKRRSVQGFTETDDEMRLRIFIAGYSTRTIK